MAFIRRMVLDTLKPHEPSAVEYARRLADLPGVTEVDLSVYEVDHKVEKAKITLAGEDIDEVAVEALIRELGGALHSVDGVVAGKERGPSDAARG
ncbi:MAG: DUF211 domain-containing protein [Alphaproteobacteria bacterium]|nr:DUF211 domain-containing protein [Alphaproteobacteria bacterium]